MNHQPTGPLPAGERRRGLTLVELLVVIAIIGVLVALLLPAVQSARESSRKASCGSQLRQLALALHQYQGVKGRLPPAGVSVNPKTVQFGDRDGGANPDNSMAYAGASWAVFILPFIEQSRLYDGYNHTLPAVNGTNNAVTSKYLSTFICPSHPYVRPGSSRFSQPRDMFNTPRTDYSPPLPSSAGFTGFEKGNYAVNVGASALAPPSATTADRGPFSVATMYGAPPAAVKDGASNVIMGGEIVNVLWVGNADQRGAWGWPGGSTFGGRSWCAAGNAVVPPNTLACADGAAYLNNDTANPIFHLRSGLEVSTVGGTAARSFHPGGCNFAFCDGSLRFISENVNPTTYLRLLAMADGNVVGDF